MGYKGHSLFAIQHKKFPYKKACEIFEVIDRPILSFLWGTFGKSRKGLLYWYEKNRHKPHAIQIHLSNEAGRRNNRLYLGELFKRWSVARYNQELEKGSKRATKGLTRRILKIKLFTEKYFTDRRTYIVLSTGLESQFTDKAHQRIKRIISEVWPEVCICRNNVGNFFLDGAEFSEAHGITLVGDGGKHQIANLDGISVATDGNSDYELFDRKATIAIHDARRWVTINNHRWATLTWDGALQGLGKGWKKPRSRTFSITDLAVKQLQTILRD